MEVINKQRGEGKTTIACSLVKKTNGILIVLNQRMRIEAYGRHGLRPDQVVTWEQATRGDALRGVDRLRPIIIDDADSVLADLLGRRVDGITVS